MSAHEKPAEALRVIGFVEAVLKLHDRQILEMAAQHGIVAEDANGIFKRSDKWKFILAKRPPSHLEET
jgi:hypothetical protein